MTYGSLVPEVKDALVVLLNARAGLAGIPTSRATPRTPADHVTATGVGEAIWIGRQGGQDTDIAGTPGPMIGGRLDPNEAFTVWLTIGVIKDDSSGTEAAAQARAYSILGEVLGAVFANPTLGVAAGSSTRAFKGVVSHAGVERNDPLDSGGWLCSIEVGLNCIGRLTLT